MNERLLVCGGRDFDDVDYIYSYLDVIRNMYRPTVLIHGGATGVDTIAGNWAEGKQIPVHVYKADWNTHGKSAGPIRNQQMIDIGKPTIAAVFPGGTGTADMTKRLTKAGILIITTKDWDK